MKYKPFSARESLEFTPRVATPEERERVQMLLDLAEKQRLLSEEADRILESLPLVDPIAFKARVYEEGKAEERWMTFVVDRPMWLHVKAKTLNLEKKDPTTKEDLKKLQALGVVID